MSEESQSPRSGPRKGTRRAPRGRPPSIDTEALLEVAREVFLERGIRATTLEVARRAGVSEGTVFHRFKSKEALFRAAMRFNPEDVPGFITGTLDSLEGMEIREALTHLASRMLEAGRVALPLMMMSWSNPDFVSPAQCAKNSSIYQRLLTALASYFEAQMEAGRLRRVDAEVLTRVFVGAVHHYGMTRIFTSEVGEPVFPEGMFVRGLVDLLLDGTQPLEPAAPRRYRLRGDSST